MFIGPDSPGPLSCGSIAKTFRMLALVVVVGKRVFLEQEFNILYDGRRIGAGYLMRLPRAVKHNSTAVLATS